MGYSGAVAGSVTGAILSSTVAQLRDDNFEVLQGPGRDDGVPWSCGRLNSGSHLQQQTQRHPLYSREQSALQTFQLHRCAQPRLRQDAEILHTSAGAWPRTVCSFGAVAGSAAGANLISACRGTCPSEQFVQLIEV